MQLEHEVRDGRLIVRVRGDLDLHGAAEFRRQVDEWIEQTGARQVVLNLRGSGFIDSTGLGALFGRVRRLRAAGGSLVVVQPPQPARSILERMGISAVVPVVSSEEKALT